MAIRPLPGFAVAALLLLPGPEALGQDPAAPKPAGTPKAPLPDRVERAIGLGVAWIRKQAFAPGNWLPEIGTPSLVSLPPDRDAYAAPTGTTSIALLALLRSGVPADDPAVARAFQWLRAGSSRPWLRDRRLASNRIPAGTYEIAALMLALEARAHPPTVDAKRGTEPRWGPGPKKGIRGGPRLPPEDLQWMKELANALLRRFTPGSGWRYGLADARGIFRREPTDHGDLSATSFAVHGLLAAERCGVPVTDEVWGDLLRWTLDAQELQGPEVERRLPPPPAGGPAQGPAPRDHARGWAYVAGGGLSPDERFTGSMTACGMAALSTCATILRARKSRLLTGDLDRKAEKAWWDGAAWLDRSWTVEVNPGSEEFRGFWLASLERAGDLAAIDVLAGRRWYEEGALALVERQDPSGFWVGKGVHKPADFLDTCFALLFLSRATDPLLDP